MELSALLAATRRIASQRIAPNAASWDAGAVWPEEALRALLGEGLGGLVVPTEAGGLGHGLSALLRVCEIVGEADASSALCFGMHSVATACLAAKASPAQRQAFLRPICAGEHLTTLALSEPGSGSHFYYPATAMEPTDGGYSLSGVKSFVTSGGTADSYVVSAAGASPEALPGHFSMVLVPSDAAGLEWGPPWSGWGMRGNSSRGLTLRGVEVSRHHRLGEEGDQIWYVFQVVTPYFLVAMAGTYLGIASRAVAEALAHVGGRAYQHSGRRLAESSVIQLRLGELWTELAASRSLCRRAAVNADRERDALPELFAAKARIAESVVSIVNGCMTLVGGAGYRDNAVLPRLLRDARAAHVMGPTTDVLYQWIGRSLLDIPLLAE